MTEARPSTPTGSIPMTERSMPEAIGEAPYGRREGPTTPVPKHCVVGPPVRDYWAERCFWTAARMRSLAHLFAQGLTRREMAAILGVSKCACIGKLHRMGLVAQRPVPPYDEARRRRLDRRNILARARAAAARASGEPPPPKPPWKPRPRDARPVGEVSGTAVDFFDLKDGMCHWPLFEGREPFHEKMYCGQVTGGSVYCAVHMKARRR